MPSITLLGVASRLEPYSGCVGRVNYGCARTKTTPPGRVVTWLNKKLRPGALRGPEDPESLGERERLHTIGLVRAGDRVLRGARQGEPVCQPCFS